MSNVDVKYGRSQIFLEVAIVAHDLRILMNLQIFCELPRINHFKNIESRTNSNNFN